jgi:GNAT superfamily N-acetyltransferase
VSPTAPIQRTAAPRAEPEKPWRVRAASRGDAPAIAAAVAELLRELGATPPAAAALEGTTRAMLDDSRAGALLVAEVDGVLVGVLAATWQTAIHIPGRYALIQDLWVSPSWRSRTIGADLLTALADQIRTLRIERVEVGLPKEGFAALSATEAFYRANGFSPLGRRMRLVLA